MAMNGGGCLKKKIVSLIYTIIIVCLCTGCSSLELYENISEDDCKVVSNYMACVVLKYQATETYKLEPKEDGLTRLSRALKEKAEAESVFNDKTEGNSEELIEPTLEPSEEQDSSGTDEPIQDNSESQDANEDNATVEEGSEQSVSQSIAEALGLDGVNIDIALWSKLDRYSTDDVYVIEPEAEKELLMVEFDISNIKEETKEILFSDITNPIFELKIADNKYFPLMTAIEDDIMFLNIVLEAGASTKAVMVFEIDKNTDNGEFCLDISSDSGSISLPLQ